MDRAPETLAAISANRLFEGGGECGALLRAIDWTETPLGPVETWPQSLRTALRICLTSRHPLFVWWGPEFIKLYNDPYIPVTGQRHPWALGKPGREVWPEIWDVIGPMLESVRATGQATWSDDQLLLLERNGYQEETYFTFSYSPIEDEPGTVGGIFTAVTETTTRVLSERRTQTARDLAAAVVDVRTMEEVFAQAARVLEHDTLDMPFALLYHLDATAPVARLAATVGLEADAPLSPAQIDLSAEDACWPLGRVAQTNQAEIITDLASCWGDTQVHAGKELTPHSALALPLTEPGQTRPTAILVAGINPRRALDDVYRSFYDLLASHLATALASAHAYEEERHRAEALAEIDRAKTIFFSNVSHEFRTPLTLMLAPLEDLLAGDSLTPAAHQQIAVIQRNGLRLLKLVNTLLDFSRIEAGRAQAVYAPTDLGALTADLASVFRSLIEKAGIRLIVDCPELSEPVYVDRDMWEKIVLNLLSNAFKFTFAGEIAVSLHQAESQAQLIVRDTGVGIPPDEVDRLFERFHRVQGTRSRTHEGSGIGLALVQELVHLHGGTIAVESQVGVGTTFTITLPLNTAHLPTEHIQTNRKIASTALGAAPFVEEARRWLPESTQIGASSLDWLAQESPTDPPFLLKAPQERPAHILLADDNADMRDYLTRLLRGRYEVEAVGDGAAALRAAQSSPPDLILSDIMMPELDGFGLLRELRADSRTRAIPVILLSARAGEEATIEGLAAGADDYLVKPFSAREVLARVEGRLEMARLRQEAEARAAELEAIFDAMTDGIDIVDAQGYILQMNPSGLQQLGLPSSSETAAYFALTPPARADHLAMRDEQGRMLASEEVPQMRIVRGETLVGPSAMNVLVRTLDGREREWEYTGAPIRDASGYITGGVVVFRDMTERRALERRTTESLTALLAMAQALVQGAESDSQATEADTGVLPRIARLIQRVLGGQYTAATLVTTETGALDPLMVVGISPEVEERWWSAFKGGKITDFLPPEMAERFYAGEVLTFDLSSQPPIPGQYYFEIQQMLGAAVWVNPRQVCLMGVEIRNRPTFTQAEKDLVRAAVQLCALVLQRDRLLREREEARARALASEETTQRMDEFLSIASHELRTPVTSIKSNVQLLLRRAAQAANGGIDDQVAKLREQTPILQRTDRQINRLTRLLEDLIDLSRIRAGKLELRPEPADLGNVVREVVEGEMLAHPERRIVLGLQTNGPIPVVVDVDRIGQVLTNYLTNAIKYSPADRPVLVQAQVEGAHVRVTVQDQGPGIPADEQPRVWELFHRVPGIQVVSGSGVGLGLGLHISKTIIERHQGQVGLASVPGAGATFWFTLPLASSRARGERK